MNLNGWEITEEWAEQCDKWERQEISTEEFYNYSKRQGMTNATFYNTITEYKSAKKNTRVFTIREVAELLGLSKPTVQKAFMDIEPVQIENNGRRLYAYIDGLRVIERLDPSFDLLKITKFRKPQDEDTAKETDKTAESTEKLLKDQIGTLQFMIDTLQSQLKAKDEQIEFLNKTVTGLSDRLQDALELAGRQQYLIAAKTEGVKEETVIDHSTKEPKQESKKQETRKRSIFGFLRR